MRPEGWENPWSNPDAIVEFDKNLMAMRTADGTTPEKVLAEDRRDIFEAGADAMLEGLKKEGWVLTGDTVIPAHGKYPEIHLLGGMKAS